MALVDGIIAGLVSSTTVIAVASLVAREYIRRVLDRKFEEFKQELGIEAKTHELALKSQIEFKERQLAEFYGPIYALLKRGQPILEQWRKGRLTEVHSNVKALFIEANNQIVQIILTKSYLIQGHEIPESFTHFLTHVAIWHAFLETSHEGVPFRKDEFPEAYYKEDFGKEIFESAERLKQELNELYFRYGLVGQK